MSYERELRDYKATIGQFHEETKSNSVTDLINWIDCKLALREKRKEDEMHLKERGVTKK